MRVLHIETGRHLYGGARQAGYLAEALARRGLDSALVCEPGHPLAASLSRATVIPCACGGDADLAYGRRLRRIIRERSPDLIHVHSRRGADTFGGFAAVREGVPALLTRRVQSREPRHLIRFKTGSYAAVVAISAAVRAELAAAGVAGDRLHLIPSAVDTGLFRPDRAARPRLIERFRLPPDAIVAGCAAQLIARKGVSGLLPLTAALFAAEPRFRLLMFGRGPLGRALQGRVRALGLGEVIVFCGFAEDWPVLLPGLDLLLHPARREGLGAAILEAMAAGVPVAAAAVGGIVDLIEDRVDGRLLPAADAGAWLATVQGLARDADTRARLARAARRKAEQDFTIDAMTDRYLDLYRHVTG